MHRDPHGSRLHRIGAIAGSAALLAALLSVPIAPVVAAAAPDPNALSAPLYPGSDDGASGTVDLTLDHDGGQACFVIAVTLTDLAGDPPTLIDVHDQTTGYPGDAVLTLTTSVDLSGAATGCVAADPTLIDSMLAKPQDYLAMVTTAAYVDGAALGGFAWSYPTTILDVMTLICDPSIQSPAQVPPAGVDVCRTIVLPKDDMAPFLPPGYTIHGYGGTADFDYQVNDGLHVDTSIATAERSGGGTCDDATMSCQMGFLPYEWNPIGEGPTTIAPTLIPAGYRFGAATAADCCDTNHVIPLSIDAQNVVTVDTTATDATSVFVYLFTTGSTDTTKPTVTSPKMIFAVDDHVSTLVPVRVSWTGHDTGSGVDHYQLQAQRDGGTWTTSAATLHVPTAIIRLAPGHDYRLRVRAVDGAGNVSTWAYSQIERPSAVQDSSGSVAYQGTWHVQHLTSALGGTLHDSTVAGSWTSLTFTARAVAWVAPLGLDRGSAKVYIDGVLATTVDLHAAAANRIVVFSERWASMGTHSIRIKVVGTSGHPRVDLDAFLLLR